METLARIGGATYCIVAFVIGVRLIRRPAKSPSRLANLALDPEVARRPKTSWRALASS